MSFNAKSKYHCRIDIYSHHFTVKGLESYYHQVLIRWTFGVLGMKEFVRSGNGRGEFKVTRVFAASNRNRSILRYNHYLLEQVLTTLTSAGLRRDEIDIVHHDLYTPEAIELELIDTRTPRDYQLEQVEFIQKPGHSKICILAPGQGKTLVCNHYINVLKERTVIVIRPKYFKRWVEDLNTVFKLEEDDLLLIDGASKLKRLMNLALSGELKAKIIVISNKTFQFYLKAWDYAESIDDFDYPVTPIDFYPTLKAGLRVIDEVHQDFHLNFRQDLYAHIPKTLSLSGTMVSDNPFMNRMYEIMFPHKDRGPRIPEHKYIIVSNAFYRFSHSSFRCMSYVDRMRTYSHVMFEKALHKNTWLRERFIKMLVEMVGLYYITVREPGQKCAIYCSTVDMCTLVRDALRKLHPTLNINRYTAAEPYETLLESDISVTTLQSAGTAVDVPNLRIIISSIALSGLQANEQLVRRLRPLKDWPDVNPEFFFLNAVNLKKHMQYANEKSAKLDGKVLALRTYHTEYVL